jgi:hypothetical protein
VTCIRKLARLRNTSKTLKKLFRPKRADFPSTGPIESTTGFGGKRLTKKRSAAPGERLQEYV